jgi:hypothetical protein
MVPSGPSGQPHADPAGGAGPRAVAPAADMPRFFPAHDTMVEFASDRTGEVVRLTYSGAMRRVRVERGQLGAAWAVVDYPAGTTTIVLPDGQTQQHPGPDAVGLTFFDARMGFVRLHDARILGHSCTTWRVTQHDGSVVDACLSEDGVPLRVQAANDANAEIYALREIRVAPVPDTAFALPAAGAPAGLPAGGKPAPLGAAQPAVPAWAGMPAAAAMGGGKPF